MPMKLVTWNINGLKSIVKQHGSLRRFLDSLDANIVCLQETTISKSDLDSSMAVTDGWDSFFSFSRTRDGYSGVATFCREDTARCLHAEEGVAGIDPHCGGAPRPIGCVDARTCALQGVAGMGEQAESLLHWVDSEGRCVITEHESLVVINIYAPAITGESTERAKDRMDVKLAMYQGLLSRIRAISEALPAKAIVLAGDFNISPCPIDSCDPGPLADFDLRPDRALLLSSFLSPRGPFVDAFRLVHPHATEQFSCWNTATGARSNNYGTRIDLVLLGAPRAVAEAEGGGEAWAARAVTSCDIHADVQGSDHAPVSLVLALGDTGVAACVSDSRPSEQAEAMRAGDIAGPRRPCPPLSSRAMFRARQIGLREVFRVAEPRAEPGAGEQAGFGGDGVALGEGRGGGRGGEAAGRTGQAGGVARSSGVRGRADPRAKATARGLSTGQTTLCGFVGRRSDAQQASREVGGVGVQTSGAQSDAGDGDRVGVPAEPPDSREAAPGAMEAASVRLEGAEMESGAPGPHSPEPRAAWEALRKRMAVPRCRGHGEACVGRVVKKAGPNQGRLFYVCARADGPPPNGRCEHFEWAYERTVRAKKGAS